MSDFAGKLTNLPHVLTLLPIKGAILMPKAHIPVPIFDLDYIHTISSSAKGSRLVGIVQPSHVEDENSDVPMSLYTAGTLARVSEIDVIEEGKMMALLEGICRFDVVKDLGIIQGYRCAEVSYDRYVLDLAEDNDSKLDRSRLLKAVGRYFEQLDVTPNWQEINHISNEKLITALAMVCPFEASEKQALLESPSLSEQSEIMTKLIEFATMSDTYTTTTTLQ